MRIIRRRGGILPEQMDILCYWIEERELMRVRKEDLGWKWPWSDDALLQHYRWCNARRMDDRVSRWLLAWHQTHPEVGIRDRIVPAAAGRLINWPATLEALPYPAPYREEKWSKMILARKARGEKIFTGAYIVNGALGGDKILQVTQKILTPLNDARRTFPRHPTLLLDVWKWLYGKPGIGSFMAGQITADLRHIHHEINWGDVHTWAPMGPGSLRGINRLLGRPLEQRIAYLEWLDVLRRAYAQASARLPQIFTRLELMDMQNCMCEYDKYCRLTNNEGTVRARYHPS